MQTATDEENTHATGPRVARDVVCGLVMGAVGLFFWWNAGPVGHDRYDWLFPVVLSVCLMVLAVVLLVRGIAGFGQRMSLVPRIDRERLGVLVFVGLVVVYVLVIPHLGFWVTSALMIAVAAVMMSETRTWRTLLVAVGAGVAAAVVGYLTLTEIFYIRFPEGPWGW